MTDGCHYHGMTCNELYNIKTRITKLNTARDYDRIEHLTCQKNLLISDIYSRFSIREKGARPKTFRSFPAI